MAGDWFPMGYWRTRCPEVVLVSSLTGRSRHEVLGWLCDLWSWVSTESEDGHVRGVFVAQLHEVIGADRTLWEAIKGCGWLAEDSSGIVVPNWERWLSESGKKRMKGREKKRRQREKPPSKVSPKRPDSVPVLSPNCPPQKGTTEQDSTGQKKEEKTPPTPADAGGACASGPPTPDFVSEHPEAFAHASEVIEPEPFAELVAAWTAAELPGHDAPGGIQRSAYRVQQWQDRFRDVPEWGAKWREAVAKAGRSARCRGAVSEWRLALDTFLRNEKGIFDRILEGEFDDGKRKPYARGDPRTAYAVDTALDAMDMGDAA